MEIMTIFADKLAGSLYGMLVGDAVAVPVHWFYSPDNIRKEYGEITGIVAAKPEHAESMVQGMSYEGTIDIMHDNARFYEGNTGAQLPTISDESNQEEEGEEGEKDTLRDDHGNFVGVKASERVHYHRSLLKGQNTANACIARLAMRYLGTTNVGGKDRYHPDQFLDHLYNYMISPPPKNAMDDKDQLVNHHDTYLDVYLRGFFTKASQGKALRDCALNQRDSWSIGSIDGAAMCIPILAAYAKEPEWYVIGRAVEHAHLTHRSITVTATLSILVPLLLELYRQPTPKTPEEAATKLREALDRAMEKMSPPKITGKELRDSYVNARGPGNIPQAEKWKQHMELDTSETTKELVHRMLQLDNDEDVAGFGDRSASRLSTACYCEQTFTVVLFLAYKYAQDPKKALLQNVMIGGHSTSRGMVLGAILGAAHGVEAIPFRDDLCAKAAIEKEVADLVATVVVD